MDVLTPSWSNVKLGISIPSHLPPSSSGPGLRILSPATGFDSPRGYCNVL